MHGKGNVINRKRAFVVNNRKIFNIQKRFGRVALRTVDFQRNLAADHHIGKLLRVGFGGNNRINGFAFSQNRHAVADFEHFIKFVGDDDNRTARFAHAAQNREQLTSFLKRQNRGRLVQNQNIRAVIKNL